jgi:transcription elongation factor Elf1
MSVVLIARADRRRPNRLPTPTCPRCGTDESVIAVIRTMQFVYFRCDQCRELLPKRIPPVGLGYGLVAHVDG